MASLYNSASNIRKVILGLFVVSLLIIAGDTFGRYQEQRNQSGTIANTQRRFYMEPLRTFGEIQKLSLPSLPGITYNPSTFLIESIYPQFPDIAYVYKIDQPAIRANTSEVALANASIMGYDTLQGGNLDATTYTWQNQDLSKRLTFIFAEQSWRLTTDYVNSNDAKASKRMLANVNAYLNPVLSLLRRLGFDNYGISDGETTIKLATLNLNNQFIEVDTLSSANYVSASVKRRVTFADLKPRELQPERLPNEVVPETFLATVRKLDPRDGSANMIISNGLQDTHRDLYEFSFTNFQYSDQKGAYLIISPSEAFTELQRGQGSLRYILPENGDYFEEFSNINLRRVRFDARRTEVGFYEPEKWENTGLIIPIYIFKGTAEMEDGRLATVEFYLDAIKRI